MTTDFDWEAPPLSAEDERLVAAYRSVGRSVDELPYTTEFEELVKLVGRSTSDVERHAVFKRLVNLRKMGRLPRLGL